MIIIPLFMVLLRMKDLLAVDIHTYFKIEYLAAERMSRFQRNV